MSLVTRTSSPGDARVTDLDLLLIRHGATRLNEEGRLMGWSDPPLSSGGRQGVRRLARQLRQLAHLPWTDRFRADEIISSDLRRARESATVLYPGRTIRRDVRLREFHFGGFEGLTRKEAEERDRAAWRAWTLDAERSPPPGGERLSEFRARVASWAGELPPAGRLAVICHGGTIGALLGFLLPKGDAAHHDIPPPAGALLLRLRRGDPATPSLREADEAGAADTRRRSLRGAGR